MEHLIEEMQVTEEGNADVSTAGSVTAGDICSNCGMCCDGSLFRYVGLNRHDLAGVHNNQAKILLSRSHRSIEMEFPCSCHNGSGCSIYNSRPEPCAEYSCRLLKDFEAGKVPARKAQSLAREAAEMARNLKKMAIELGYIKPRLSKNQSLNRAVSRFLDKCEERTAFAPLFVEERRFLGRVIDFLEFTDRHIERREYLQDARKTMTRDGERNAEWANRGEAIHLKYRQSDRQVEVHDCPEVVDLFPLVTSGWDFHEVLPSGKQPAMRIWKKEGAYYWDTPHPGPHVDGENPPRDLEALCDALHYHLLDFYEADHPDRICLHAATLESGSKSLIILGDHQSGKSTLALEMVSRGMKCIGDDRVALDPATGSLHAIGTAFAIRKPLPKGRSYVSARMLANKHAAIGSRQWQYLKLPSNRFAGRGEAFSPGPIIIAERKDEVPTKLVPVHKGDVLRMIVKGKIGSNLQTVQYFDALLEFLENRPVYRLTYQTPALAAGLLEKLI